MALTPTTAGARESTASPTGGAVRRTLVAGVGNLFLGDDGFGAEVARALARSGLPAGVTVTDYGIRGMHLAYDLLDDWDRLILIDLVPGRGRPGTVHIIDIDPAAIDSAGIDHAGINPAGINPAGINPKLLAPAAPDPHGMAPDAVLAAVTALGGTLPPTVLVGCEPAAIGEHIGLSEAVAAAVQPAADAVLRLLAEIPAAGGR